MEVVNASAMPARIVHWCSQDGPRAATMLTEKAFD